MLITEQQALAFLNSISSVPLKSLDSFLLQGLETNLFNQIKFDYLEEDSDREDEVILVDGDGTDTVWCIKVPMVSITSIKIINLDGTKQALTIGTSFPQVTYDPVNGSIKRVGNNLGLTSAQYDDMVSNEGCIFPNRKRCVEITGVFGLTSQTSLLQYILQLMLLKHFSTIMPDRFQVDLAEEKFANYSYKLRGTGLSATNQILTLDSYIQKLIDALPKNVTEMMGSI